MHWRWHAINRGVIGSIAYSRAGRDKGNLYVVVAEDARGYYALVDGNTRLWDKPKWKNPRHVQLTHDIIAEVFGYDYDNLGDNPDASMNKIIKSRLEAKASTGKEVG